MPVMRSMSRLTCVMCYVDKEEALQAAITRFTAPGMHRWMKKCVYRVHL
jgi:hypothetical protein